MGIRKFRLLMSKYGFSIAIILVELFVIFGIILYMSQIAPIIWVTLVFFISVATVIAIVNRSMSPESKVTWLIVTFVPVFGPLLYIMFGERRLSKKELKQLRELRSITLQEKHEDSLHQNLQETDKSAYGIINALLHMDSNAEVYEHTDSQFFANGEEMWQQMLEDLKRAKKFIFLEYYIVEEGLMWDSMLEILEEKAAQGVEVKMLYDDIGCMVTLPGDYTVHLRSKGIDAHKFNKVIPRMTVAYNNRDHRKIAVIDGHTAFTGGINLADEYINRKERFGHWKDSGICLHGEAVWSFTVMFLQMWSTITGMECNFESYRPEIYHEEAFKKDGFVQPYGDSPLDGETVGEHVYLNIISQAKKYLYIFTPYLIPDNETLTALCMAAKRGVDVRIVTPGIPDKKIVYILTQANYEILLESGVQIYQYTPGFIHSKSFVCDDEVATVGTINMDYRSMYLHFECGVWMYGSSAVAQVKEDALITFEQCEQINMDYCRKKNFAVRALRGALKFLAPLL